MEKVDIKNIKLSYSNIEGTGKEIFAYIGQEVPCVEFTMKGNVSQPIAYRCMPTEISHRIFSERWIQFEPDAWNQMIDDVYKELVNLWNEKYCKEE